MSLLIPHKYGIGASNMGVRKRGSTGMYKWDHLIGKSMEHKISAHMVSRLS